MGGDEVAHGVFEQMPSCQKLIEENKKIDGATWQNYQPTTFDDLQAYFTKKYVKILVENGFSPAAWEEPWTYGAGYDL